MPKLNLKLNRWGRSPDEDGGEQGEAAAEQHEGDAQRARALLAVRALQALPRPTVLADGAEYARRARSRFAFFPRREQPGARAARAREDRPLAGEVHKVDALCRGAWARVTVDQFRHSALQTGWGHRVCHYGIYGRRV